MNFLKKKSSLRYVQVSAFLSLAVIFVVLFTILRPNHQAAHAAGDHWEITLCPTDAVRTGSLDDSQPVGDSIWQNVDGTQLGSYKDRSGVFKNDVLVTPNSGNQCTGTFFYGWSTWHHEWQWTWQDNTGIILPGDLSCNVAIWIPAYYAGDPNAQYTLSNNINPPLVVTLDQNKYGYPQGEWVSITNIPIQISDKQKHINVTLNLHNGSSPGHYIAADAIRFDCLG